MMEYREDEMIGRWNAGMFRYRNNGLVDSRLWAGRLWDEGRICEPNLVIRNPQPNVVSSPEVIRNPQLEVGSQKSEVGIREPTIC